MRGSRLALVREQCLRPFGVFFSETVLGNQAGFGIIMKVSPMLLAVAMLAGCASAPRQLPRATASDLASADDKSVCLAGNLYPNTHADAHIVKAEYMKRLNAGRFTHQQCAQFYAGVMRNKQQSEAESAAAWSDVAYQLGKQLAPVVV